MVKFKSKAYKVATSYAIIIPKDFIKHDLIDVNKILEVEVKNESTD